MSTKFSAATLVNLGKFALKELAAKLDDAYFSESKEDYANFIAEYTDAEIEAAYVAAGFPVFTSVVEKEVVKPVEFNPAAADATNQIASALAQMMSQNKGQLDIEAVKAIIGEEVKDIYALIEDVANVKGRAIDVTSKHGVVTIEGMQHKQFDILLRVISSCDENGNSNLNVWMTGLPGTGKTRACQNVAQALNVEFYCNGSIANKYELIGFKDAHGNYQSTPFRDAWEKGGVYLFDEVDGSVPSAVLAFNSALANGIMAFPDGMLKRHPNCIIIAAANTSGQGATAELVGRMKQDAAFLDRFVFLNWELDEALEKHIAQNDDWCAYVQQVRRNVATKGVKIMVTPRATFFGAQLLRSGMNFADVKQMTLRKGLTDAQWQMIA
jgi:cobaltochelatase CobS